jgi:hypothetical protein
MNFTLIKPSHVKDEELRKKLEEGPDAFMVWYKKFEQENPELPDLEWVKKIDNEPRGRGYMSVKDLQFFINRACFDAAHFKDIQKTKRKAEEKALKDMKSGQRKKSNKLNPVKAIEKLRKFINAHPEAAEQIANYWYPEAYGVKPVLSKRLKDKPPLEMLEISLNALKFSFEKYADLAQRYSYYPLQYGPIVYPLIKEPERIEPPKNPAIDGLIANIALLFKYYFEQIPYGTDVREIPRGPIKKGGNQFIARFVEAVFKCEYHWTEVKARLDSIGKNGRWEGWPHKLMKVD